MGLLAEQKRIVAEKCIFLAFNQEFEKAAKIRQQEYAINPPGSYGVNWGDWESIWKKDWQYLQFMLSEDFSDCNNTLHKISMLQAGIFIDYLFDFSDSWGVKRQSELSTEKFRSDLLERFLQKEKWDFFCENKEVIYASTKKKNIFAKMYYKSVKEKGFRDTTHPPIFEVGNYYLGFLPGTSKEIIEGRRKFLQMCDLFLKMKELEIDGFPKTFQTFQKHYLSNSPKYQNWVAQYDRLK